MNGGQRSGPEPDPDRDEGQLVKSAVRTLKILEALAAADDHVSFTQLQRLLGIPKSSLHSLLATMTSCEWVSTDARGTGFALGPRARRTLPAAPVSDAVIELSDDLLEDLRDRLGETIHLAVLDGADILYLASKFSRHALGVRFHPGRRLGAYYTALGKAMLAECPPAELDGHLPPEFVALTPNTLTSRAALSRDLEATRVRGYAIDDEESALGLRCFAVAIVQPGLPPHAISCSTPTARLDPDRENAIVNELVEAQRQLLRRLRAADLPRPGTRARADGAVGPAAGR
jgi:DNA-binding IclR family transcriptional regulator